MRLHGATFPTMSSDPIEQFLIEEAVLGAHYAEEQIGHELEHARARAKAEGERLLRERQGAQG